MGKKQPVRQEQVDRIKKAMWRHYRAANSSVDTGTAWRRGSDRAWSVVDAAKRNATPAEIRAAEREFRITSKRPRRGVFRRHG